jgi:hypothetical protein
VKEQLEQMAGELGIGELIVNTIVWDHAKRLRSYELLAEAFSLHLCMTQRRNSDKEDQRLIEADLEFRGLSGT